MLTTHHAAAPRPPRVVRLAMALGRADYRLGYIDGDLNYDRREHRRYLARRHVDRLLILLGREQYQIEHGEKRP